MILLWMLVSVGVGVACYYSGGCASAFGGMVCTLFALVLLTLVFSAC